MKIESDFIQQELIERKGKARAVPAWALARLFDISERIVRSIVRDLRHLGHPICSGTTGYYFAENLKEQKESLGHLKAWALDMLRTVSIQSRIPAGELAGQLKLHIEEKMEITVEKLRELSACEEAIEAFPRKWGESVDAFILLESLRDRGNFDWANWLIVRLMTRKQCLAYAIFAAEKVLYLYENKYPNDFRVRAAIEAAKKVLKNNTLKNMDAAWDAAWAVGDARDARDARDANPKMQFEILDYGISLLKQKKGEEDGNQAAL